MRKPAPTCSVILLDSVQCCASGQTTSEDQGFITNSQSKKMWSLQCCGTLVDQVVQASPLLLHPSKPKSHPSPESVMAVHRGSLQCSPGAADDCDIYRDSFLEARLPNLSYFLHIHLYIFAKARNQLQLVNPTPTYQAIQQLCHLQIKSLIIFQI
jgi:hypothetical protein